MWTASRRSVWLSGTVATMSTAFGVTLQEYSLPRGGSHRGRTGEILIPANLAGIIVGVFGLDNRPHARPCFRLRKARSGKRGDPTSRVNSDASSHPQAGGSTLRLPHRQGRHRAVHRDHRAGRRVQAGRPQDVFHRAGPEGPRVSSVSVNGGKNTPSGGPDGPDGEVMLDIEVAGAVAPGARIVVYFCPNTSQGFLDAITQAVHDTMNKPSVISISWGGPELSWTAQAMQQYDQAFQAAAAVGVTVCVAAGDGGSSDGVNDGLAHVDFPASSPNVLACGGTTLDAGPAAIRSPPKSSGTTGPTAAPPAAGSATSSPLPSYQQNAGVPPSANPGGKVGRGLPDVAGDADPNTGYEIRVNGSKTVIGGTSAVAPLWAGLVALLNQAIGKPVGFFNPNLYGSIAQAGVFRDITSGNNGAYSAGPGWDACSGWGVADGAKLLAALKPASTSNA